MKQIYKCTQMKLMNEYPIEVMKEVKEIVNIINKNYGVNRNIKLDLGGYVAVAENIDDIKELKLEKLKGISPEYIDILECKEGVNWTSSLFLLSSNYSIVVICIE